MIIQFELNYLLFVNIKDLYQYDIIENLIILLIITLI